MLRGTCYYNKKIKVKNVARSAKILVNVQMVHILMLLWQHARFQSLVSSKSNSTTCSCGSKIYKKC